MKLFDLELPFFAPVWIRIVTVAVCLAWGSFEFVRGAPMWGFIFVGVGAIAAWRFATIDYATIVAEAKQREKEDS